METPEDTMPEDVLHTYFVQPIGGGLIKIGQSTTPQRRMLALQCGSPVSLILLGSLDGEIYPEGKLHEMFKGDRSHGEWFRPSKDLVRFLNANGIRPIVGVRGRHYGQFAPQVEANLFDITREDLDEIMKIPIMSRLYRTLMRAYTIKSMKRSAELDKAKAL
jgi:hypothetical protein